MTRDARDICPATNGYPTTMTGAALEKICAKNRIEAEEREAEHRDGKLVVLLPRCLACPGPPDELTLIDTEEIAMATTKKEGTCECCGKQGTTGLSHAKWVCSMCANVRSNIKQRPEAVLASLRELQPELFVDETAETVSREKYDHLAEMGRALNDTCNQIIKQLEDREKQIGQLHLERDALRQEIAGLHGRITDVTAERDAILTADIEEREQRRDLALKLAIGLLRGEVKGVGLDDIEQLRGV